MRICCAVSVLAAAAGQFACLRAPHPANLVPPRPIQTQVAENDEATSRRTSIEWFNKRHPDGGIRQKAVLKKQRLAPSTSGTSGQWTAIGPQPIQSYGSVFSGRVWGIAVDPRNSSVVYVGTDGGGVWNTTNGGATWAPLTDSQANINIRDLTLAPSSPDTIFAATNGGGILKSTDDGATWSTLHPSSGDYVPSVSVHPTNASIVLAGGCNEISRSTDGGSTWSTTLNVQNNFCVQQVVFDPTNGNIAYAAMGDGLHRSADGGVTWSLAGNVGLPSGPFSYVTVAIAPSSPGTLYLALKGTNDYLIGFYRSANSGAAWTQVGVPPNDDVTYWGWSLRVHPTNPNLVYAGSLLLSMSTDGGNTWAQNDNGLHVDHHVQTYSADNSTLYIGNDGGIWSTTTPTAANTSWTSLNATLNTALFYPGISISPLTENTAFGGTQDNGILKYQATLPWTEVACGDGGFTAIDFVHPQNVYAACQSIAVNVSTDGGNTFSPAQSGINLTDPVEFIPPLVMDPSNSSRLYFGTNRVYQTVNGAGSWTAISSDLTVNSNAGAVGIVAVAVAPSDPNTVYTGTYGGIVFVSRNALSGTASTWTPRDLPSTQLVTQITVDPQNPLTAWAACAYCSYSSYGGVSLTTDGGVTWTNLSAGLPNVPVNDILLDPDILNTVYAATDIGVYRSVDGGQSWLPLGTGLPNVIAHSLRLYRPTRTLRVATYGRGMWDLSVPASGQTAITIASSTPGAYFSLEDGTTYAAPVSFYWNVGAQHTVTWLSSPPGTTGTRDVFSGWTDGIPQNARTIVVSSVAATYTANVNIQYLLTVTQSPAVGGSVVASPASPDGYYSGGTSVTLTAMAAFGYGFSYFSGDVSGSSPQSIAMNAPHNVTANYYCNYQFYGTLPSEAGPGPTAGLLLWTAGAGCAGSASSNAAWLSAGSAATQAEFNTIQFTLAPNTGGSRSGTVTFNGSNGYSFPMNITQDAVGTSMPSMVSLSPNNGNGSGQVFTLETYDANGYGDLNSIYLQFETTGGGAECSTDVEVSNGTTYLWLLSDSEKTYLGPLTIPGIGTLSNKSCSIDASQSAISGSGYLLNVNLGLSFTTAFAGSTYVYAGASTASNLSTGLIVGTWTIPSSGTAPAVPVLASPSNGATGVSLTPALSWSTAGGAASYDVYFGASLTPPLATNTTSTDYTPGMLDSGSTYYWQIVARNSVGTGASPVWSFTTSSPPALSISKTHSGIFMPGQNGAIYVLTVSNAAVGSPTTGMVTVTETVPSGMTLASMSGTGWSCQLPMCSRSEALTGGASYPAIAVAVNVAANAPSQVTNQATVAGGGSASSTANDITTLTKTPPFGSFDIPTNGETGLAGEVNNGGWALSMIPVTVQIWRDPVPHEATSANGLVFVGDTTFITGTRPDIAAAYPGYLNSNAAGWGAQILSNELPNGSGNGPLGNGTYTLHALATDADGGITDLGAHTIAVNNAASLLPFGTIDTPAAGATISGTAYVNFGWALTPQPNMIPTNGSTINVFIDNKPMGHPVYNNPRSDIEALFPGYANTDGAVGYLKINTTTLSNGLHQISWGVTDNAGHKNGIGSRYFFVQN